MHTVKKEKLALSTIFLLFIAVFVVFLTTQPIAQDAAYHDFSDTCSVFGIPNFWNVVSNLLFLFVGVAGLYKLRAGHSLKYIEEIKVAYTLLFLGVMLVAFGSAYYHIRPNNMTLVWDRLPMTVAFMALFSIIIAEFISVRIGKLLLFPLIVTGIISVFYWYYTETLGVGDLRLYIIVQFLPILIIPLILLSFRSRFTHVGGYWVLLLAYGAAKLFEYFDAQIFNVLGIISGHSLKHVVAALGVYGLLLAYQSRQQSGRR